ncbi:MAG: hypothetical protein AB7O66_13695 [Limisphaerales bacterium]
MPNIPRTRTRIRPPAGLLLALALTAASTASSWAAATVGIFTGGDPDEGLDLQGNFTYAVNVGPNGAAGKVGDADFTGDSVPGITVDAQNNIGTGGWLTATLGDTANDDNLEKVLASIRWSAAPAVVTVQMRVEPGVEYKLQVIQGEQCCPGRGFNIILNGETLVEDFMPGIVQSPGGDFAFEKTVNGAVITHQFIAATNNLVLVLSGPAALSEEINDRNAILNGFTLERLSAFTDVDGDGLRDDWEASFFGDTSQGPTDDSDSDGLTNKEEYDAQLNPASEDTDGDGLTDGDEVNTHKTDPADVDSDGDGLRDGAEILTHKTDPTKRDSDGDGANDYDEVRLFSDPNAASSGPRATKVGLFTGGDAGEGLDLTGNFVYALDHGVESVLGGQVGDAFFIPEVVDGVTVDAGNRTGIWNADILYGETGNDLSLAEVMNSITWSDAASAIPRVTTELANLTPGSTYKLQLLFAEQAWPRGFDVYIDDMLVMDDFSPAFYQGGGFPLAYPDDRGVVVTHDFVARASTLRFILDGTTTTTPEFTDHNAIINASTLELIGPAADTDSDQLPDLWEMNTFGNLDQTGTQDSDGDGLTNRGEFDDGANPTRADSDGDGLNDAEEKAAGTKPGLADTDRDGLTDSAEVNTHKTNPLKADSDDDLFSDAFELAMGGDPNNGTIEIVTAGVVLGGFTGGDADDGLDLDGTFQYAFSILPNTTATGKVRDAVFTSENVPGVTVANATSQAAAWYRPDFGDTENDNNIERIVGNIRHGGGGANIRLANLIVGRKYKLQLLFGEACCSRGMDIYVDGKLIADEFAPFEYMGDINNPAQAAFASYEFTATKDVVIIQTLGSTVTTDHYTDRNPIINAVTLEDESGLPITPVAPVIRSVSRQNGVAVTFDSVAGRTYTLQYKASLSDASWSDAASGTATGASTTLTDSDATHQAQPSGFWRVRVQ